MAHKYEKHKLTKHRTLEVPEGFEFIKVEKDEFQPHLLKVVFKKKER